VWHGISLRPHRHHSRSIGIPARNRAALSISLGIFNLFPFPALDGGRIIFLLPELVFRRRVPARVENLVHALGMTFLLLFMIYVNVMDFVNPINLLPLNEHTAQSVPACFGFPARREKRLP
jgi:hypothetical protein